jgi:hypothetical protein
MTFILIHSRILRHWGSNISFLAAKFVPVNLMPIEKSIKFIVASTKVQCFCKKKD